ncbi:recombinase family protein [Streptomyces sp. NPDC058424]|uniref:recombinase family protein n=1 Tax=Streptomyces sp. NPDC058424 TaxID=3346491 RepID=UPI00364EF39A
MILEFGAFESDRTGEQWKEVHEHRLAAKLPSAGRPRAGYVWHPRRVPDATAPGGWRLQEEKYEPDPKTAPYIASCYAQYIAGTGFIELARQLNAAGLRTTRGKAWRQDSLLKYLDSGFAAGYLRARDDCDCAKKQGARFKSCEHWRYFRGGQPTIITYGMHDDDADPEEIALEAERVWREYRARRGQIKRTPPRARVPAHDLTGLVRCSGCGGAMAGRKSASGACHVFWRCPRADAGGDCRGTSGTGPDLDALVAQWLEDVAADVDALPTIEPVPERPEPSVEQQLAKLRTQHAQLQDALTRLITDYAVNPQRYPAGAYDKACKQLEQDRDRVAQQLAELGGNDGDDPDEQPTREDVRPLIVGMLPEWPTFTTVQRNLILRQVIRCVRVFPRPGRRGTRAEVVPVWAPLDDDQLDGESRSAAMLDGIAWSLVLQSR